MLILTRRIGESIYIGDEVRLTVLGVRGTQVRIGINAPKGVPVHREEIYYRIKNEQGGGSGQYDGPGGQSGAGAHDSHDSRDGNYRAPNDDNDEQPPYPDDDRHNS